MRRPPYTKRVARGLGDVIAYLRVAQDAGSASELFDGMTMAEQDDINAAIDYIEKLRKARAPSSDSSRNQE